MNEAKGRIKDAGWGSLRVHTQRPLLVRLKHPQKPLRLQAVVARNRHNNSETSKAFCLVAQCKASALF